MNAYDYERGKKNSRHILRLENKMPINKYIIFIEGKELKSSSVKGQYALRGDQLTFTRKQIDNLFNVIDGKRFLSYRFFWDCSITLRKKYQKYEYKHYRRDCCHHVEIKLVPVRQETYRQIREPKNVAPRRESVLRRFETERDHAERDLKRVQKKLDKLNRVIKSF